MLIKGINYNVNDNQFVISHSARNKDQKLVGRFKNWMFYRLLHCCPIENVWEIWPIKIDFGRPITEIGQKMASGQLLFLALSHFNVRTDLYSIGGAYTYLHIEDN